MTRIHKISDGNGGQIRTVLLATHVTVVLAVVTVALTATVFLWGQLSHERGRVEGQEWQRDQFIRSLVTRTEFEAHKTKAWHDDAGNAITGLQTQANRNTLDIHDISGRIDNYHVKYRGSTTSKADSP